MVALAGDAYADAADSAAELAKKACGYGGSFVRSLNWNSGNEIAVNGHEISFDSLTHKVGRFARIVL